MAVTALWCALLAGLLLLETVGRLVRRPQLAPLRIAARLRARLTGQIALFAFWAFVGWHLFARYTIPR